MYKKVIILTLLFLFCSVSSAHVFAVDTPKATEATAKLTLPESVIPKGFFTEVFASIESFRIKELAYFTELRDASKQKAEKSSIEDVTNLLLPDNPGAPGSEIVQPTRDTHRALDFGKLMLASLAVSVFAHQALFLALLGLLAILVVRFVFRLF